jgi:flagellar M-ring protein FliF
MTDQLQMLLRQLTIPQRISIAVAAFASLLLLAGFVMWAGKPDLQPAFTKLTTEQAGTVSEALRGAKIQFELTDGGATILVPTGAMAAARVAAGQAGYSGDGATGFEIFDTQQFGASEFDQQVAYQRAIEGKLRNTIGAMQGVAEVQVSVVAAQRGLFSDQDRPASASVNLRMQSGTPDASMVRGIVSTVAAAVAGLTPDAVTVVDDKGRVLAGPALAEGGDAMAIQSNVERGLANKLQSLVDQALGPGHASVAVSAQLDLNKVEKQVTTVLPINTGNWTPTSVQQSQERYGADGGAGAGGIPGSGSNVPGLPTYPGTVLTPGASPGASAAPSVSPSGSPSPSAAAAGYVKEQQTVNYANSQTIEKIIQQPGAIQRLSVAVLLDQAAMGSISAENLKSSIEAAIGADKARGDNISVAAVPFAAATVPGASSGGGIVDSIGGTIGSVVAGLVALVLVFLVWRNLKALRRRADDMQLLTAGPANQALLESGYSSTGAAASIAPLPEFGETAQAKIQERLRIVADEKPEEIVGLVNSWLWTDGKSAQ